MQGSWGYVQNNDTFSSEWTIPPKHFCEYLEKFCEEDMILKNTPIRLGLFQT